MNIVIEAQGRFVKLEDLDYEDPREGVLLALEVFEMVGPKEEITSGGAFLATTERSQDPSIGFKWISEGERLDVK